MRNYEPFVPTFDSGSESNFFYFTLLEVNNAYARLFNKKGSGMDNLSGFFTKIFESDLIEPLA